MLPFSFVDWLRYVSSFPSVPFPRIVRCVPYVRSFPSIVCSFLPKAVGYAFLSLEWFVYLRQPSQLLSLAIYGAGLLLCFPAIILLVMADLLAGAQMT